MTEETQTEPRTKTLSNGAVYDLDQKRIIKAPPVTPERQAQASTLARIRWEKYRKAAIKRIVGEASSIDPTVSTGADAFGLVASKQFTALMDSDRPRIADLEKLGQIMTGTQSSQREDSDASANLPSMPPASLMQLVELIEQHTSAAVERARAVDATSTDIRNDEPAKK